MNIQSSVATVRSFCEHEVPSGDCPACHPGGDPVIQALAAMARYLVGTDVHEAESLRELLVRARNHYDEMRTASHMTGTKEGDPIWYRPSLCSQTRFAGVAAGAPWLLGDTPVIRLRDMEPAYWQAHHPKTKRTTVAAAVLYAVTRRTP